MPIRPTPRLAAALAAALAPAALPAAAQEPPPRNFIAIGPALTPDHQGSSDYEAGVFVTGNVFLGPARLELDGVGARLDVSSLLPVLPGLDYGPALRFQPGRSDVENAQVDALPEVDDAVELGGFLRYGAPLGVFSADQGFVRLDVLADVADGHGGVIATLVGDYTLRPIPRLGLSGLVSTSIVSDDYADSYFSVTGAGAAASGLSAYQAGGGVRDVSAAVVATWAFTPAWGVVGVARVSRLLGDAADSPIVKDAGDANQFILGGALSYAF